MSSRRRRGKTIDRSTTWSEWIWDARGYHYCYRLDESGEYEYRYSYPNDGEFAAEEGHVPVDSSSPPTRPATPGACPGPAPLKISYGASSMAPPVTVTQSQSDLWGIDTTPEVALEPQTVTAGWSADPASTNTYYSLPTSVITESSKFQQRLIPTAGETYFVGRRFVPKVIKILLDKKKHFAKPDTGSEDNMMSRAHAEQHGISIRRRTERIRLGTGKFTNSIGKASVRVSVPGIDFEKNVDFHVLRKCPNPLIMGSEFVADIQLYTKNKHLLVERQSFVHSLPILNRAGSRMSHITFTADGHCLKACPDTGSDLDFISEGCARRCGFMINEDDSIRRRIMLGDTSTVDTIGQVEIKSVELKYRDGSTQTFPHTFHVLRGLCFDAIFGEEFLDRIDAFNTCQFTLGDEESSESKFNGLEDMGPLQMALGRLIYWQPAHQQTEQERHDELLRIELHRRMRADRGIPDHETELWRQEHVTRTRFAQAHERCGFCRNLPVDGRPSAWQ